MTHDRDTDGLESAAPAETAPQETIRGGTLSRRDLEREIETLRRRCEAAEAAGRARAGLLAMMSHEIREPMNGVLGMVRLLTETPLDVEQRSFLDSAIESAEALLTIVSDVLDLTRIDAGRLELAPVEVDLASFLERLRVQLEPRALQRGIGHVTPLELPGFDEGQLLHLRRRLRRLRVTPEPLARLPGQTPDRGEA